MSKAIFLAAMMFIGIALPVDAAESTAPTEEKPADNQPLKAIFDADQSDRTGGAFQRDWKAAMARDKARRDQAADMLREGRLRTARDYFHAAMIFQHSHGDIRLAHALSTVASHLDPGHKQYRWLVAASWDRLLMQQVQPQWYGTQYQADDQGIFLFPVAEDAVTDEERAEMGVPALAEAHVRLKDMAASAGKAPRDTAPTIADLQARARLDPEGSPAKRETKPEE